MDEVEFTLKGCDYPVRIGLVERAIVGSFEGYLPDGSTVVVIVHAELEDAIGEVVDEAIGRIFEFRLFSPGGADVTWLNAPGAPEAFAKAALSGDATFSWGPSVEWGLTGKSWRPHVEFTMDRDHATRNARRIGGLDVVARVAAGPWVTVEQVD